MDLIKCVFPAFSKFPGIFPGIFPATTILENLLSYPKIRSCHEYLSLAGRAYINLSKIKGNPLESDFRLLAVR